MILKAANILRYTTKKPVLLRSPLLFLCPSAYKQACGSGLFHDPKTANNLKNTTKKPVLLRSPLLFLCPSAYKQACADGHKKSPDETRRGFLVGAAGFEPTTSCSQSRRDTGLRYAPWR